MKKPRDLFTLDAEIIVGVTFVVALIVLAISVYYFFR
jgi:hypothetical protein